MSKARPNGFALPPHANEAVHKLIMKRLRSMNSAQFFETLVDAGIYGTDRKLRPEYAPETVASTPSRSPSSSSS